MPESAEGNFEIYAGKIIQLLLVVLLILLLWNCEGQIMRNVMSRDN